MTNKDELSIFDLQDKVETDHHFNDFIEALMEEMDRNPEWGKRTLKEFLHGMWTFNDAQVDVDEELTWKLVADILLKGFTYS